LATASFCFEGEEPTLLAQNLALLRGRDDSLSPGVDLPPAYNRLYWNYTYGLDAGQVIYALNYNITDQNGDGKVDAVVATRASGGQEYISVLTGKGDGTFASTPILTSTYSSTTAPTIAQVPQIVNVADLNGDSNPDLIVNIPGPTIVNFQAQTQLQVYLSNGDGTFKPPSTIAIGADAYATVLADFNKDGKPDLAALTENSASQAALAISLGKGDGTFAAAVMSNLAGGDAIRSSELAAADFDDDGNIDLALIDSNDFSGIFYGKGAGTFTSVPFNGNLVPKDLINVAAGAGVAAAG